MTVAADHEKMRGPRHVRERFDRAADTFAAIFGSDEQEHDSVIANAVSRADVVAVRGEPGIEHPGIDRVVNDGQALAREAESRVDLALHHARDADHFAQAAAREE